MEVNLNYSKGSKITNFGTSSVISPGTLKKLEVF